VVGKVKIGVECRIVACTIIRNIDGVNPNRILGTGGRLFKIADRIPRQALPTQLPDQYGRLIPVFGIHIADCGYKLPTGLRPEIWSASLDISFDVKCNPGYPAAPLSVAMAAQGIASDYFISRFCILPP